MWWFRSILFVALFQCCTADYDTVILSVHSLKNKTMNDMIGSYSKMLAIGVRDFSLPKFSTFAQAYSVQNLTCPFASLMPIYNYRKALAMEEPLMVTRSNDNIEKLTNGADYITTETLKHVPELLASYKKLGDYQTIIISSQDAFESQLVRRKRVSSDVTFDEESGSDGATEARKQTGSRQQSGFQFNFGSGRQKSVRRVYKDMPIVLPPELQKNETCLLYMEAFDIIIGGSHFITVDSTSGSQYSASSDHYSCNMEKDKNSASFLIEVKVNKDIADVKNEYVISSGTTIKFELIFKRSTNGYWYLSSTNLHDNFKIKDGTANVDVSQGTAVNEVDIGTVFHQNFACSQTQAAVFNASGDLHIGIALRNFEVNVNLPGDKKAFGYYTTDCIGTFSAGTWMGIIVAVVFASIVLFGYLMVQSIQTMDRFDDPKQKQIMINFKE